MVSLEIAMRIFHCVHYLISYINVYLHICACRFLYLPLYEVVLMFTFMFVLVDCYIFLCLELILMFTYMFVFVGFNLSLCRKLC